MNGSLLEDNPEPTREPAIGYRAWWVSRLGLQSLGSPVLWEPGVKQVAHCRVKEETQPYLQRVVPSRRRASHRAPEPSCTCGIYSHHEIAFPQKHVRFQAGLCMGAVCCWGRVIIHGEGLRAEFAALIGLWLPLAYSDAGREAQMLAAIARAYQVPLFRDRRDLVAFATEFGVSYAPITD